MTDETIIGRVRAGDSEAFAFLVDRYRNAVYGLAFHHLGNAEDARDVAQEAFVCAFQRLRQLHDPVRFAPWLRQITVNICRVRQRHKPCAALPPELVAPEDTAARIETRVVLEAALQRLSPETRLTLTLFYAQGRSLAEIAAFLEAPVTTIKSRLRDARARLRKELLPAMKETFQPEPLPANFTVRVMHALKADGAVYCLAFSPDGRLLAHETFGYEGDQYGIGDIYIREVRSGAVRATLPLNLYVPGLSWSPDGKTLTFACYLTEGEHRSSEIRLWRWETGELQTLATIPNGLIRPTALSPDGKWLAAGTNYKEDERYWGEVSLRDFATRTVRWSAPHLTHILYVAFSPDVRLLAASSGIWDEVLDDWSAGDVQVWETATGRCLRTMEGPNAMADSNLAFSPDGKRLAVAYEQDKSVLIWDAETGKVIRTLTGHENRVVAVTFSPDGRLLASGGLDNTVRLWDAQTGAHLETLAGHERGIHAVTFTPDGKTLASSDVNGNVKIWQVK